MGDGGDDASAGASSRAGANRVPKCYVGELALLGELACLPAFRDELGASGLSPAALEALLFRVTQGVSRTVGRRAGGARRSAPWRAPFMSTGNVGVLGRMAGGGSVASISGGARSGSCGRRSGN
jgi:hypothetical protein